MTSNLPYRLYNYFRFEGLDIIFITFILFVSTSIFHLEMIKLNNFLDVTLKTYFFGFDRTLCSSNRSNILIIAFGCSSQIFDLANTSST